MGKSSRRPKRERGEQSEVGKKGRESEGYERRAAYREEGRADVRNKLSEGKGGGWRN